MSLLGAWKMLSVRVLFLLVLCISSGLLFLFALCPSSCPAGIPKYPGPLICPLMPKRTSTCGLCLLTNKEWGHWDKKAPGAGETLQEAWLSTRRRGVTAQHRTAVPPTQGMGQTCLSRETLSCALTVCYGLEDPSRTQAEISFPKPVWVGP